MIFLDTNVLLYLLSDDTAKADRTESLLAGGGTISVQVLNEFAATATRKLKMDWPDVRTILSVIRAACEVVPVTLSIRDEGVDIASRYKYSIYDSLIVAAALSTGCDFLYSEDLQDGQSIGAVTIANPFHATHAGEAI